MLKRGNLNGYEENNQWWSNGSRSGRFGCTIKHNIPRGGAFPRGRMTEDWTIVVTMDWSGGFWQRMIEAYPQIVVL